MDKKKTGNLIKEARIKKNYTQSELGDLLGVSNKAVSRWENGDSFPDVGILENLASVLELRIQDIITGDVGTTDESVVTEVVRVAKLQQKEKKRRAIRDSVFVVAMLCCIISGYLALGNNSIFFAYDSILVYVIFMLLSFILILVGCTSQNEKDRNESNKIEKYMKIVSVLSFIWSILMSWCVSLCIVCGNISTIIDLPMVGPLLNWQLVAIFILNLVIIIIGVFRYEKKDAPIHWGWFISLAAMYICVLYGDMLHRISSVQGAIETLAIRTIVVLVATGISLVVARIIKIGKMKD